MCCTYCKESSDRMVKYKQINIFANQSNVSKRLSYLQSIFMLNSQICMRLRDVLKLNSYSNAKCFLNTCGKLQLFI